MFQVATDVVVCAAVARRLHQMIDMLHIEFDNLIRVRGKQRAFIFMQDSNVVTSADEVNDAVLPALIGTDFCKTFFVAGLLCFFCEAFSKRSLGITRYICLENVIVVLIIDKDFQIEIAGLLNDSFPVPL